MKRIIIAGKNYTGNWNRTRYASRTIVIVDRTLLLSYAANVSEWMLPGGGRENGESDSECAVRETAEETGYLIQPSECILELTEYYENVRYISRYYTGSIIGSVGPKLTEGETELNLIPRWLPVKEALREFSEYRKYIDTDEMRRGLYQREYIAVSEVLNMNRCACDER